MDSSGENMGKKWSKGILIPGKKKNLHFCILSHNNSYMERKIIYISYTYMVNNHIVTSPDNKDTSRLV